VVRCPGQDDRALDHRFVKGGAMKKLAAVLLALVLPALVLSAWAGGDDPNEKTAKKGMKAIAVLEPTAKSKARGVIRFVQKGKKVEISGEITGLEPGEHAFHIHEFGDCSDLEAKSAGGHFNPTNKMHGAPEAEERHVGDLGNIKVDDSGKAVIKMTDSVISLRGKESIIGRSVIIHVGKDDFKTQPTGNAGDRAACGVIGHAKD
jgi:Cu-Zn family superoxide dismutase